MASRRYQSIYAAIDDHEGLDYESYSDDNFKDDFNFENWVPKDHLGRAKSKKQAYKFSRRCNF